MCVGFFPFFFLSKDQLTPLSQLCESCDICPDLMTGFGFLTSQMEDDLLNNKRMRNPSGSALFISASDLLLLIYGLVFCVLPHQKQTTSDVKPTPWHRKASHTHRDIWNTKVATPDSWQGPFVIKGKAECSSAVNLYKAAHIFEENDLKKNLR